MNFKKLIGKCMSDIHVSELGIQYGVVKLTILTILKHKAATKAADAVKGLS